MTSDVSGFTLSAGKTILLYPLHSIAESSMASILHSEGILGEGGGAAGACLLASGEGGGDGVVDASPHTFAATAARAAPPPSKGRGETAPALLVSGRGTSVAGKMMVHKTSSSWSSRRLKLPPAPWHAKWMWGSPARMLVECLAIALVALLSSNGRRHVFRWSAASRYVASNSRTLPINSLRVRFVTLDPGGSEFFTENTTIAAAVPAGVRHTHTQ
mmetsp:Transcript_30894/g.62737  ORF Transcript_30894/g.62737 Transcript_30894/m.62737 type:complete len:216 (-) Transcript_30894:28-675(-)